jgi:hypothetical protein
MIPSAACSGDAVIGPQVDEAPTTTAALPLADSVADLLATSITDSSVTVTWTQVDDGAGGVASYLLKFSSPPLEWSQATTACESPGDSVGAEMACTVAGLAAESAYDFQVMSYRGQSTTLEGSAYSEVVRAETVPAEPADAGVVSDLLVSAVSESSVTVTWTQVDDGTGSPARYRVKYAAPPILWGSATTACQMVEGTTIDSTASCTISGLAPSTSIEAQVVAYRVMDGIWVGAVRSNVASGTTSDAPAPAVVGDLSIAGATDSTLTVRWTQIDDGAGRPASYRVKYSVPSISYGSALTGCATVVGDALGAEASCTIANLDGGTDYEVQLMSYRIEGGVWENTQYSNVAAGRTEDTPVDPGIWIGRAELAALPMSGPAWDNLRATADGSCGLVALADQTQDNNVCVMAKALAYARTGNPIYAVDVVAALTEVVLGAAYDGSALALGRELAAYVIAADLVGLKALDPTLDASFRVTLRSLLTTFTSGAASSLVECQERRPNNWGTHCGASRAAIAAYLGDETQLARVAEVFKGWLGDRGSYSGFVYGDLSWQCDPSRPVGINPAGCTRDGQALDGVIADDQRRAGSYAWPPPKENYVWEALQGALAQAVILERAGYPAFEWEDRALLRAAQWLHDQALFPAEGDDTWQPHVLNYYYGTYFPAPSPARAGKNVGWTDWTHGR